MLADRWISGTPVGTTTIPWLYMQLRWSHSGSGVKLCRMELDDVFGCQAFKSNYNKLCHLYIVHIGGPYCTPINTDWCLEKSVPVVHLFTRFCSLLNIDDVWVLGSTFVKPKQTGLSLIESVEYCSHIREDWLIVFKLYKAWSRVTFK